MKKEQAGMSVFHPSEVQADNTNDYQHYAHKLDNSGRLSEIGNAYNSYSRRSNTRPDGVSNAYVA
jgi:hypothetical protein